MPRAFLVKRFDKPREQQTEDVNNNLDPKSSCDIKRDTTSSDEKPHVLSDGQVVKGATASQVGSMLSRIVLDDCVGASSNSAYGSEAGSEKYELLELESESESSAYSESSSSLFAYGELEEGCLGWKEGVADGALGSNAFRYMLQHTSHGYSKGGMHYSKISNALAEENMDLKPQFQCNQCDKTFKTKYTLNIHRKMPSHTTLKPFVCPTCGKGFRLSSTLCRHKIIHTSQRPHRCSVCQKSFNRSSTLKTHLRTHSNEKEFACDICGKGFHQKGNLRNHVLIHTGEKPYECSVCKKSFNKLSNLKFHMHSHTDQKPYRCRFCKETFCKRGELKTHIARCKKASHDSN